MFLKGKIIVDNNKEKNYCRIQYNGLNAYVFLYLSIKTVIELLHYNLIVLIKFI
jgi:hypothetical protein